MLVLFIGNINDQLVINYPSSSIIHHPSSIIIIWVLRLSPTFSTHLPVFLQPPPYGAVPTISPSQPSSLQPDFTRQILEKCGSSMLINLGRLTLEMTKILIGRSIDFGNDSHPFRFSSFCRLERLLGCQLQFTDSRFSCLLLQSGIAQGRLCSLWESVGCLINPEKRCAACWFPEIRYPEIIFRWDGPWNKPSRASYWGTPMNGNPHRKELEKAKKRFKKRDEIPDSSKIR